MATVMSIINVNNESFYKASRCTNCEDFCNRAESMIKEGTDILDIGACSTKPGSSPVSMQEEWNYLNPIIDIIATHKIKNITISIDTFRSEIVRRIYDKIGYFIVNDISAGEDDAQMLRTVGKYQLPYIAMHKRGTPDTMQQLCSYPNGVTKTVIEYFKQFHHKACDNNIKDYIIDPGFGFAKTIEQNYELLQNIPLIKKEIENYTGTKHKFLVGISRKSMIWRPLEITSEESLCATSALNLQALINGADILRVHDTKEAIQCIKLYQLLKSVSKN